ncbi:MAG: undecaprenyl diphosphate synthase family protein, partial [Bacteroidales bacterium]|nr:undecaprenyl diphosphate synthase family protein [Bacteroidales bacterium]
KLASRVQAGSLRPESITEEVLGDQLAMADLPDPDLCIRTAGEQRISNFLLWQLAYTELYFAPMYWPDFDGAAFDIAVEEYYHRQRRFGGSSRAPAPALSAVAPRA